KTGVWRTERPVYVDLLPPCNQACPAGENIQGWLYSAEEGGYEAAWRTIMADNPLPAVMGRGCYHPCETACNRRQLDEAVGINSVERFLGDLAIEHGWQVPDAGARQRGRGGDRRGRAAEVAVHDQARRRRQDPDREDGAGRDRLPAADRRAGGV